MKTLEEIKTDFANSEGYESWTEYVSRKELFGYVISEFEPIHDKIAEMYASQVALHALMALAKSHNT